jgi:hypothetical protein
MTDNNMWATHSAEHNGANGFAGLAIDLQSSRTVNSIFLIGSQPGNVSAITVQYSNTGSDWSNLRVGGTSRGNWTLNTGNWERIGSTQLRGVHYPESGDFRIQINSISNISARYWRVVFTIDRANASMIRIGSFEAYQNSPDIDYNIWQLQTPRATFIHPANNRVRDYSDFYFYRRGAAQTFMCPQFGLTTPNSTSVRAEMRQLGNWRYNGTNTLRARLMISRSPGMLAVGQVFCETRAHTMSEIFYSTNLNSRGGNITILYSEARGASQMHPTPVQIPLHREFQYEYRLNNGHLEVFINGVRIFSRTPTQSLFQNEGFYFKFGNYDQSSNRGNLTTSEYSTVNFFTAKVNHS